MNIKDMETELIGHEIGYLKPVRTSLTEKVMDTIAFMAILGLIAAILIAL